MSEQNGYKKNEIKKILKERRLLIDEIEMLDEDISGFDMILTKVKTTNYGEQISEKGGKMSDRYSNMLDKKITAEEKRVNAVVRLNKINKALEVMRTRYDAEYKIFRLRYMEGQTLRYIGRKIGCGRTKTIEEINISESVFERLMK